LLLLLQLAISFKFLKKLKNSSVCCLLAIEISSKVLCLINFQYLFVMLQLGVWKKKFSQRLFVAVANQVQSSGCINSSRLFTLYFLGELSLKGLVEDSSGLKKKLEVLFWLLGKWVLLDLWLWHWLQEE
jgi:hypothetical protein